MANTLWDLIKRGFGRGKKKKVVDRISDPIEERRDNLIYDRWIAPDGNRDLGLSPETVKVNITDPSGKWSLPGRRETGRLTPGAKLGPEHGPVDYDPTNKYEYSLGELLDPDARPRAQGHIVTEDERRNKITSIPMRADIEFPPPGSGTLGDQIAAKPAPKPAQAGKPTFEPMDPTGKPPRDFAPFDPAKRDFSMGLPGIGDFMRRQFDSTNVGDSMPPPVETIPATIGDQLRQPPVPPRPTLPQGEKPEGELPDIPLPPGWRGSKISGLEPGQTPPPRMFPNDPNSEIWAGPPPEVAEPPERPAGAARRKVETIPATIGDQLNLTTPPHPNVRGGELGAALPLPSEELHGNQVTARRLNMRLLPTPGMETSIDPAMPVPQDFSSKISHLEPGKIPPPTIGDQLTQAPVLNPPPPAVPQAGGIPAPPPEQAAGAPAPGAAPAAAGNALTQSKGKRPWRQIMDRIMYSLGGFGQRGLPGAWANWRNYDYDKSRAQNQHRIMDELGQLGVDKEKAGIESLGAGTELSKARTEQIQQLVEAYNRAPTEHERRMAAAALAQALANVDHTKALTGKLGAETEGIKGENKLAERLFDSNVMAGQLQPAQIASEVARNYTGSDLDRQRVADIAQQMAERNQMSPLLRNLTKARTGAISASALGESNLNTLLQPFVNAQQGLTEGLLSGNASDVMKYNQYIQWLMNPQSRAIMDMVRSGRMSELEKMGLMAPTL